MIKQVPAEIPVTNPELSTVAILGAAETHGDEPAAVPDPVNCVVAPTHTMRIPVIVGFGFVVILTALLLGETHDVAAFVPIT